MSRVFVAANVSPNQNEIDTSTSAPINSLTELTWAFWAFVNSATTSFIINKGGFSHPAILISGGWLAQMSNNLGASTSASGGAVTLGVWTHVAMTFSFTGDKKTRIYVNGVLKGTSASAMSGTVQDDSASGFTFGNFPGGAFGGFSGNLAEAVIYNAALTAPQVAALAASTTGATAVLPGNIVGYWHLLGIASPEPDSSGNGNAGVLSANPPKQGPNSPGYAPYSVPDCRNYATFPNASRTINGTKIYDVQTSNNSAVPGVDSRVAGILIDCRVSPNIPENSRTLGTFGPGE